MVHNVPAIFLFRHPYGHLIEKSFYEKQKIEALQSIAKSFEKFVKNSNDMKNRLIILSYDMRAIRAIAQAKTKIKYDCFFDDSTVEFINSKNFKKVSIRRKKKG